MPYPAAYDIFLPHGTLMNEEPLHENVHVQLEDSIEAIEAELGLNPSGTAATVVARLNTIEATNTSQGTAITTAQNTANARTPIASRFVTLAGTSALGNNAINLRVGTVIVTLNGLGQASIPYPSAMPGSYVPIACNGDTATSNTGASVGVLATWDANGFTVYMQRADGSNGSGSVRINYLAIGL